MGVTSRMSQILRMLQVLWTQQWWHWPTYTKTVKLNLKTPPAVDRHDHSVRMGPLNHLLLNQSYPSLVEMQSKYGAETVRKAIQRSADTILDTVADVEMCLKTGVWYGCPLRVSASTWLIQMQIFTANHWNEPTDPNGRCRGRDDGAEGGCN